MAAKTPVSPSRSGRLAFLLLTLVLGFIFVLQRPTTLRLQEEDPASLTSFPLIHPSRYFSAPPPPPPQYLISAPPPTPEEEKLAAVSPFRTTPAGVSEGVADVRRARDALLQVMGRPTASCRKMLRQGGTVCRRISDGDKMVCLDPPSSPPLPSSPSPSCLVYSIGSGGEMTFDMAMGQLGCHVMIFEDNPALDGIKRHPSPRVNFLHVLLSTDEEVHLVKSYRAPSSSPFVFHSHVYLHRPLDNIMFLLHHYHHQLDFLKIDIDGGEFEALEHSLFKTDILERTRQLAIEIHLFHLLDDKVIANPHTLTSAIANYTRVLVGLEERGLRLVHFQPNARKPGLVEVAGKAVWVFAEQLWINTRLKEGVRVSGKPPAEKDLDELEMA